MLLSLLCSWNLAHSRSLHPASRTPLQFSLQQKICKCRREQCQAVFLSFRRSLLPFQAVICPLPPPSLLVSFLTSAQTKTNTQSTRYTLPLKATINRHTDILSLTSSLSLGSVGLPLEEPMTKGKGADEHKRTCRQAVAVSRDSISCRQPLARTLQQ